MKIFKNPFVIQSTLVLLFGLLVYMFKGEGFYYLRKVSIALLAAGLLFFSVFLINITIPSVFKSLKRHFFKEKRNDVER